MTAEKFHYFARGKNNTCLPIKHACIDKLYSAHLMAQNQLWSSLYTSELYNFCMNSWMLNVRTTMQWVRETYNIWQIFIKLKHLETRGKWYTENIQCMFIWYNEACFIYLLLTFQSVGRRVPLLLKTKTRAKWTTHFRGTLLGGHTAS